jgi:suppressor for copper-sensitivity B
MILVKRNSILTVIAALAGVLLATAQSAAAGTDSVASAWDSNGQVEMRLVSATRAVGDLESLRLGLHFRLRPGWKIYWRSPGEAGYPPEIDWSQSANLAGAEIIWPVPTRFTIFGMETMGYKDEVVLPLDVRVLRTSEPVSLRADVSYLTCKEVCVPWSAVLALDLPAGPAAATPEAALIDRYRARVPLDAALLGMDVADAALKPVEGGVLLRLSLRAQSPLVAPDLFVEGPLTAFFARPEMTLSQGGARLDATLRGYGAPLEEMLAQPLRVTLVDGDRAVEQLVTARQVSELPALPTAGGLSLVAILGLALLGGLILNLMPCVLPVLSLKFLGVLGQGGRENREVRIGFLATVAGILTSFMLLAAMLTALKMAGASIGWGIQFQQPAFLAIMVVIVILFAANMFGLFEFRLPQAVGNLLTFGGGEQQSHSLTGHFLTGAFATLLATPCSAPFLGTAVGFALSRDPGEIFLVFAALGLGLSAPYLAIAAFPGLATRLPRPGKWMVWMKRVLGILLAGTGVWLATVIAVQAGAGVAAGILALAVLMIAVLALQRLDGSRLGRHAGKVSALLAVAAIAAPLLAPGAGPTKAAVDGDIDWRPFDRVEIRRLVAGGKTVLVDVTADWCLTCQINKAVVLYRKPVAALLEDGTVIAMRADWTLPNQDIADYLAAYGRYGIPFNAVYGPQAPDGVVLGEILTTDSVLAAIEQAGGDGALALR